MTAKSKLQLILAALFLVMTATATVQAQVPPVGPSGPTGWCTDKDGKNFRC